MLAAVPGWRLMELCAAGGPWGSMGCCRSWLELRRRRVSAGAGPFWGFEPSTSSSLLPSPPSPLPPSSWTPQKGFLCLQGCSG